MLLQRVAAVCLQSCRVDSRGLHVQKEDLWHVFARLDLHLGSFVFLSTGSKMVPVLIPVPVQSRYGAVGLADVACVFVYGQLELLPLCSGKFFPARPKVS